MYLNLESYDDQLQIYGMTLGICLLLLFLWSPNNQ